MGNDTTQQGVSSEERQRPLSPRELAMQGIDERLDEERTGQMETPAPERQQDDGPVVIDDLSRYQVPVRIGDRQEVKPLDSVLAELQTANGRLKQVAGRERELDARERALQEREQQITAQAGNGGPSDEDADDTQTVFRTVFERLAEGDIDEAATMFEQVVNKGRQTATPQVDTAALASEIRGQITGEQVWDEFLRDNPEFRETTDATGEIILSEQRQFGDFVYLRDYAPLVERGELGYREALNKTREAVSRAFPSQPAEDATPSPRQEKLSRKERIDRIPVAAGARQTGPATDEDDSPAAVIAGMRKARNLSP